MGAEGDEVGSVQWVSVGTHPFWLLVGSFWFAVCVRALVFKPVFVAWALEKL